MAGFPLLAQAPPTAKIVTPPKEHFGFELGDDYCLANYKQLESYWKKLEKQTDRMKVVKIGTTEEGRDHLMAIVSSPANIAKLDRYKEIARKLATAEATPEEAARKLASRRGRPSSGSTAAFTRAKCCAPRC